MAPPFRVGHIAHGMHVHYITGWACTFCTIQPQSVNKKQEIYNGDMPHRRNTLALVAAPRVPKVLQPLDLLGLKQK